jgi:hypothetical protein
MRTVIKMRTAMKTKAAVKTRTTTKMRTTMKSVPKRPIAITLAAMTVSVAALAGCASPFQHASKPATPTTKSATTTAQDATAVAQQKATAAALSRTRLICSEQVAWNVTGEASVKALYADTGALQADASADNLPGLIKAGHKLTSDAIAAATLPLPPVGSASWKALTAAYAAAGTALAAGDATGAVPQLQAGSSAISAFTTAIGTCSSASL